MTSVLIDRCRDLLGLDPQSPMDDESMIGFFQKFRPDGSALAGLYDGLPNGDEFQSRLMSVFAAAGHDRRDTGGRDAYFIVRNPPTIDPDLAKQYASDWLTALHRVATTMGDETLMSHLRAIPRIRVLEGSPPKQPKRDLDTFPLLRAIKVDAAELTSRIDTDCDVVTLMRSAYYYCACDSALRDYLLWPAYAPITGEADPLAGYFYLWRHGVKLRVFHDDMIDLYLPRTDTTTQENLDSHDA